MKDLLRKKWDVFIVTILAVATGLFLRAYLLGGQVFIDDEWHGFYYAQGKSPGWLLTHFSIPGATCIPLNFYTWLLGKCGGWSEYWLRLPSLICGMACVFLCPVLVGKITGKRPAIWLLWLLALSPVLIFYSRLCRPYSAVAFFGFTSILLAAWWQRSNRFPVAALFVSTGVLAVYFHLFAVVAVAAPFLVTLAFHLMDRFARTRFIPAHSPSLWQWFLAGTVMAVVSAILVLPALVHSMQGTFFDVALKGGFDLHALPRVIMLVGGTRSICVVLMLALAMIAGAAWICRQDAWLGATLLVLYPLHVLALVLARPDCAHSAIVLVRYCIPLVPVSLLLVSCGIQAGLEVMARRWALQPPLQTVLAVAALLAYASTGPLPSIYVAPNNFTNHGGFQHDYALIDWRRSFASDLKPADFVAVTTIEANEVSPFYGLLAEKSNGRPIVEYPMMIGDHFNPLYYYQHFHRRPVLLGYTTDANLQFGLAAGNVYGNTYIDQVLSLVEKPARLRFRNLVSMDNLAAMRERNVEFIVIHKCYEAQLSLLAPPLPPLARLYHQYQKELGKPAYEDAQIAVFRL